MGKLQKEIALLSLTVAPETTERVVCPACHGGTSGEVSLAITKDASGVILYHCHRASCGVSGRIGGKGGVPTPKKPKLWPYEGPLRVLRPEEEQFFEEKFGLTPQDMPWIRYSDWLERFMLPVTAPDYRVRGWVARSFDPDIHPKALSYIHMDEPFQGWHRPMVYFAHNTAILVEDYFSACKVAKAGMVGISLNGVHLTPDGAQELMGFDSVILALDEGTMPMMLKIQKQYGHLLGRMIIWSLDKDLKYESVRRIQEAVANGKTAFKRSNQGTGILR